MLGWRGRFGYISPSTIQLPWELQDLLPDGVGVVATVLSVRVHTDEEFQRAQQGMQSAVEVVAGEGAQAVVLGGVPLAVRQGFQGEEAFLHALREKTGVPAISGMAAAVEGLRHLKARRPVVATAYLDSINELIARYLDEAGMPVAGVQGLRVTSPAEASRVAAWEYYRLARQVVAAHPDADSVFLGTRGNVREVAVELEHDLGLPVVYGSQAGLWWALRQLGVSRLPANAGRLFDA